VGRGKGWADDGAEADGEEARCDVEREQDEADHPGAVGVDPEEEEEGESPDQRWFALGRAQDEELKDEANPAEEKGAGAEGDGREEGREDGYENGGDGIARALPGEEEDAENDGFCGEKGDGIDAVEPGEMPPEIEGKFGDPLMVHPGRAGGGEGEEIALEEVVGGELDLDVAEVPPDVGIGHGTRDAEEDDDREPGDEEGGKAQQARGPFGAAAERWIGRGIEGHEVARSLYDVSNGSTRDID
jgi:hypothetical protein